jgi:hypothetical protein
MTFFLTGQPDEAANEENTASSPPAHKSNPLFKQDNMLPERLAGEHLSLSAYISKHLQDYTSDSASQNQQNLLSGELTPPRTHASKESHATGVYLNSLDVEMAAGLEQYLPSPIFRMQIAKRRLDGEIQELRQRLAKYEKLTEHATDMQAQISALRSRLAAMERRRENLGQQLSANLGVIPRLYAMLQQKSKRPDWLLKSGEKLKTLLLAMFYGPSYFNVQTDRMELQGLQELYAECLKVRGNGEGKVDADLEAIVNRFEQVAQGSEMHVLNLKPISFSKRLWQEARGLVK